MERKQELKNLENQMRELEMNNKRIHRQAVELDERG